MGVFEPSWKLIAVKLWFVSSQKVPLGKVIYTYTFLNMADAALAFFAKVILNLILMYYPLGVLASTFMGSSTYSLLKSTMDPT